MEGMFSAEVGVGGIEVEVEKRGAGTVVGAARIVGGIRVEGA